MSSIDKPSSVAVGCWVKIKDPDVGEETIYLVDKKQERPESGRYSPESPFAQALLGAKHGQKVIYTTPDGGRDEVEVLDFDRDS